MDSKHLLETDRAQKWLEQFSDKDRTHAALLLESLHLVDRPTVESAIETTINNSIASSGTTAVFAVRELDPEIPVDGIVYPSPDDTAIPPSIRVDGRKVFVSKEVIRAHRAGELEPRSYFPSDKTDRPPSVRVGTPVGSEGPLANFVRDICKRFGGTALLNHPSLAEMKATKTRKIILIDDVIGSGRRINTFIDGFLKHKTIRSWLSYKLITIQVITYAGSIFQIERLKKHPIISNVDVTLQMPFGASEWNLPNREAIGQICQEYARLTSSPNLPYGFGNAFTCLCFDYACPNTAPSILWAGSSKWMAMFDTRPNLDFVSWPLPPDPIDREKRVLAALGQKRLSESDYEKYVSFDGRRSLGPLAFLAKGLRDPRYLAAALSLDEKNCLRLIRQNYARGWLTAKLRITDSGKAELRHARKLRLTEESDDIELSEEYYIPQSLRVSRD
jgi:hypothetical protein